MSGQHCAPRKPRHRLWALLAGLGLGAGLAVGGATVAQAQDPPRLCGYVATHPGWQVNGLTELGAIATIAPGVCSVPITP